MNTERSPGVNKQTHPSQYCPLTRSPPETNAAQQRAVTQFQQGTGLGFQTLLQPHEARVSRTATRKRLRHQAPGKHSYCTSCPQPRGELHMVCTQAVTVWTAPCSWETTQTAQHSDLRTAQRWKDFSLLQTSKECSHLGVGCSSCLNSVLEAMNPAALWFVAGLWHEDETDDGRTCLFHVLWAQLSRQRTAELGVSKETTLLISLQAFPLYEGWPATKASDLPWCSFFTYTSGLLSVFSPVPGLNRF